MASSGYIAWAVTAGEVPTTAYWNILGANDASFNTGNGFNDAIIQSRHMANSSILPAAMGNALPIFAKNDVSASSTPPATTSPFLMQVFQTVPSLSAGAATVTFPTAFPNGALAVFATFGDSPNSGSGIITDTLTTTNFRVRISGGSGGVRIWWLAFGW